MYICLLRLSSYWKTDCLQTPLLRESISKSIPRSSESLQASNVTLPPPSAKVPHRSRSVKVTSPRVIRIPRIPYRRHVVFLFLISIVTYPGMPPRHWSWHRQTPLPFFEKVVPHPPPPHAVFIVVMIFQSILSLNPYGHVKPTFALTANSSNPANFT